MLNILSYIIKITFSITITYFAIYFYSSTSKKYMQKILSFNFLSVFLLSPIYSISFENDSLILYGIMSLILFCILFYNVKSEPNEVSLIYLLSLCVAILISCGFILYSIICVSVLIYLINYLIPILNNESSDVSEIE